MTASLRPSKRKASKAVTRIAHLDQVPARVMDPALRLRRQPRPGPGPRAGEAAGDADVAGAGGGGAGGGEVVEEGAEPVEGVRDGQVPALDSGVAGGEKSGV